MKIKLDLFPGGVAKALTLSWDDGRVYDRQLVAILNRHGLKGSFHLNSGFFGKDSYITREEVASLYEGHEISAHTSTHPFLSMTPREGIAGEVLKDREQLEQIAGYPVRGMSYPFGDYNDDVLSLLPALGIEYSRTVRSHGGFTLPDNLLAWHPTCHHRDMLALGQQFLEEKPKYPRMQLLYVWGHSYEFNDNNNWGELEQFASMMGGRKDIWYATNIEIADYLAAVRGLRFSASRSFVYNPSAVDVWVTAEDQARRIPAGATVQLG
ncbi:polysaccharide deacetylase family protein [Paenibacillus jilunlii]|uniref:Polysaccharide deacetylase n=1 Tax=Paenibacillus jilunlii TaxID=682956 RepID=A0A1G9VWN8_9BACL|nr:polysaccharide deacetylase family protein [Paenibacillus jilunlii]KWX76099.1 polysaccharide deacetylase [Paenibacillus jilunlii]SDM76688.1 Polysaccharide deacetylase [Paenibacillus jilunlii]